MKDNFDKCLSFVLVHEGGYSADPHDPGGATNKGVTQAVYDGWRKSHGHEPQSVVAISAVKRALIVVPGSLTKGCSRRQDATGVALPCSGAGSSSLRR